jgi:hypothetical protein
MFHPQLRPFPFPHENGMIKKQRVPKVPKCILMNTVWDFAPLCWSGTVTFWMAFGVLPLRWKHPTFERPALLECSRDMWWHIPNLPKICQMICRDPIHKKKVCLQRPGVK